MPLLAQHCLRDALSRENFCLIDYFTSMANVGQIENTTLLSERVSEQRRNQTISAWLLFMCALVALMVVVGGATRLTDSGLSITEWKPVTGAVPPLSEAAWYAEFEKYQQIPEYQIVNNGMSMSEFKTIYWWEWGHRLLGRVIGAAFLLPLIYFAVRGWLSARLGGTLFAVLVLIGAQGALGWYMVQSGLTARVDVSQYRLAAHLGLAVFLFAAMFWVALDLRNAVFGTARSSTRLSPWAFGLAAAVFAQIILGAFVAGLRAGHTYTTWPLMDGAFFPSAYFIGDPDFFDAFNSVAAVQFNHRIGAYAVALIGFAFVLVARGSSLERRARLAGAAILFQIMLGIATLVSATPIGMGLVHQAGALLVLSTALYAAHGSMTDKSITAPSSSV